MLRKVILLRFFDEELSKRVGVISRVKGSPKRFSLCGEALHEGILDKILGRFFEGKLPGMHLEGADIPAIPDESPLELCQL